MLLCALVSALSAQAGLAAERRGMARAIDADSLELGGIEMRLHGIDAPEWGQACRRDGRAWDCGAAARDALVTLLARGPVECRWQERDAYGRALATCFRGAENLNATLVRQGHALAYRRYSHNYAADENAARRARRGLWAGEFEAPWAWRRQQRDARATAQASDCAVKGNVNRQGERIYHERTSAAYPQVRVKPHEGDRCFEDVASARAAGFRAPRGSGAR
ncbi:MAG: thermonuclease family protein [Gammaproteobacteria bacterium]